MSTATKADGHTRWYVPDAFIPSESSCGQTSHESICLLNVGSSAAEVTFAAYFADDEPRLSDPVLLPAERAYHLRTDDPDKLGGLRIPAGVPYALMVTSDIPVLAQYSRLDTTQGAYTLMTATPTGRD
ncbi:sensory rhodopsin transducer [Arthrobacter sp. M-10]|uniref:sensory rhodopsin transducer n=1 Tax=Arthrobacter sp. M-10 TaxID=3233037 RepID=UPI003F91AFCC